MKVSFDRGILLPGIDLWLDPWDERPTAFVSHAHADHIGNHQEIILSEITSKLMAARLPGDRIEHRLPFHTPFSFRRATITLLPAGHIFGSAQIHLETDAGSLLYTGDFKLRHGKSAEAAQWRYADTLVMETTYGLPKYVFPPTDRVVHALTKFCIEAVEDNQVPVLFGYSLGKAQEILAALNQSNLRILLHPAVYKITKIYQELNQALPPFELYNDESLVSGSVVICPPNAARTRIVQKIKQRRTAVLTGWALNPGAIHRYQCDAAFPLSDHADYPDLVRLVELVNPKRVLTVHGFAHEFAEDLRRKGIDAWSLGEENQLELVLPLNARKANPVSVSMAQSPVQDGFGRFTATCDQIEGLTGKLKKIEILSDYLRSLSTKELPTVATFLSGRAFPGGSGKTLQVGWAVMRKALMEAAKIGEAEFRAISAGYGDAGRIAYEVFFSHPAARQFQIIDIENNFESIQAASGPTAKTKLLSELLNQMGAKEASYVVRILTGDLRIGLKEGLLEEAIARAFEADLETVRETNMLTGDIGQTALLAIDKQLHAATVVLFRPVKCMLAIPEPSSDLIWQRIVSDFAERYALAEPKFDGIRAQLHIGASRAELFSRDLRNISSEFPELADLRLGYEAIFDGEIIAYLKGRKLSFFDLQRRLGRKRARDLFDTDDVPVVIQVFDLLWLNGQSLMKTPLLERRERLSALELPDRISLSPLRKISDAQSIDEAFHAARQNSYEGLMIKDPASIYTPGRRGGSWIKFKKEFATLDVVVVGAELGHGKRNHVLSDYTFAVRDEVFGNLLTIGKAYSGLTDQEIEELTEHFTRTTIRDEGRFRQVIPAIVLEIAFDSIQPSDRHSSGLALRFPRIKAIRRDKQASEIDTVQHARKLAGLKEF